VVKVEESRLAWEKDKWKMEAEMRSEDRKANLESQRLSIVAALLKQGITDKDIINSVLNRNED
jgi:hypothetical protein